MARAAAAAESPESAPVRAVEKPAPDPTQPIECSCLVMDRPYGVNQTNSIIRVGSHVATGITVNGLCERIVLHPNGTFVVHIRTGVASSRLPEAEKAKHKLQYIAFREGHGEVLQ